MMPRMTAALSDFDGLLNWPNLQEWFAAQPDLPGSGPVTAVEQLTGGSQNNIFLLTRGAPGSVDAAKMVLRRPPEHLRKNSNDTMLREARVLGALEGTDVPHPEFYGSCADTDVIGTTFYLMEPIDGFTPMGPMPGRYGTDPSWRRQLAFEMVDGAAKLGAVDADAVGLGDFGKPENWLERQVSRWRSQLDGYAQFENYGTPDIPDVDRVGAWLDANRPAEAHLGIIHGDYQFANVMFAPNEPKLAAIVDWELSTLGDPLLDLGWVLTSWIEPGDPSGKDPLLQPWDGMPSRAELVARYAETSGRDVSDMPWFFVLACYKLGILLEGTHARAGAGQAPAAMGDIFHGMTLWLFARANQSIDEA
jgi:aminoglycoside phosphotransferase (APT) family kinase protein